MPTAPDALNQSNPSSTPRTRLLIVEDESPLRNALVRHFEWVGFEVDSAANGVEALERIRMSRPDILLLDYRMPKLDGPGLLSELARLGWKIPAIMLTSSEDVEEAKLCMRLGARDFLTKPVSLDFIERTVFWHLAA